MFSIQPCEGQTGRSHGQLRQFPDRRWRRHLLRGEKAIFIMQSTRTFDRHKERFLEITWNGINDWRKSLVGVLARGQLKPFIAGFDQFSDFG
jgi:hypothetical protein